MPNSMRFACFLALAAVLTPGCAVLRSTTEPIPYLELVGSPAESPCLVVLLPGAFNRPEGFSKQGFDALGEKHTENVAFVAVDAHMGYYRQRSVLDRLREDVLEPARAAGAEKVWLVGVSLGGLGSLLYAEESSDEIEGLFLLAPFIGDDHILREIREAGGPTEWSAEASRDEDEFEVRLWSWLQRWHAAGGGRPAIYLGYGEGDGMAEGHHLLAEILPPERVFTVPGGHDWKAWRPLWERFLETGALDSCSSNSLNTTSKN